MKKLLLGFFLFNILLFGGMQMAVAQSITVTSLTSGLSPDPLNLGQSDLVLFGFSITVSGYSSAVNIDQINLKAVGSADPQSFFSNGKLYRANSNTTTSYSTTAGLFTQVAGAGTANGSTVEIYTNQIRTLFNSSEVFPANTTTTKNYFFVADFTLTYGTGTSIQFTIANNQSPYFVYYNGKYANGTNPSNTVTGPAYNVGRTLYWRVTGNSTAWGTGSNWSNANNEAQTTPPTQYDNVSIGVLSRYNNLMPTLSASTTVNKITFGNNFTPQLTVNSGAVLTATSGIVVNASSAPVIAGSGTLTLPSGSSSTLGTSASLSVTPAINNAGTIALGTGTLTANGNLTNTGTITTSGTVNFSGTAQTITNNSATAIKFQNVTFGTSGTKTLAGTGTFEVNSTGVLTVSGTATLATAGKLTLKSDATGSASVAAVASATTITGDVKVERFLTGNNSLTYRGYRLLSSSVNDASSGYYNLSYLKGTGTYLTGAANGGFDVTGNPTIYLYRDNLAPSSAGFTAGNYRAVTKINNSPAYTLGTVDGNVNMPVGTGFLFFFRGNNTTTSSIAPANVTLTQTGPLNQGAITVKNWTNGASTLSYSDVAGTNTVQGFNLIGNPYACSINWNTHYSNTGSTDNGTGIYAPNMGHAIYIYNPVTKNYSVYTSTSATTGIASGSTGGSNIIPAGQGFFVRATSAAAKVIFYETSKSSTSQVTGSSLLMGAPVQSAADQHVRLQLSKDSTNTDETVIVFNKGAKADYDVNEDVMYLKGSGLISLANLSSDKQALAINQLTLPSAKESQKIKLSVAATTDGLYKLNLTELANIPDLYDIWLMDAYKKDSLDIKHNPTYTFNINTRDTASMGNNRFTLIIRQNPGFAYRLLDFAAKKAGSSVQITWKTENEGDYTYFTLEKSIDGGKTFEILGSEKAGARGSYSLLDKSPIEGVNVYRLKQEDINGEVTYSQQVTVDFKDVKGLITQSLSIYPNPVNTTLNLTVNNGVGQGKFNITITNSFGRVLKTIDSPQSSWQGDVSSFLPGTYFVKVINERDKSVTSSTFLKL